MILVKTNLTRGARAHAVLVSSDRKLTYDTLLHYYRLRFQIEMGEMQGMMGDMQGMMAGDMAGMRQTGGQQMGGGMMCGQQMGQPLMMAMMGQIPMMQGGMARL